MKNKVQVLREAHNLTQTELSEKSGLSLRTIQRIEAGNIPRGFTLRVLAKALDIEPEKLFISEEAEIDIARAKLINISSLSFLILPFGNIIIPAILTYKSEDAKTKEIGKSILSIQIIWMVITSVLMIASSFLQSKFPLRFPLFIIFLILLFCLNTFIILKNGVCLNQNSRLAIKFKIGFL